MGIRPYVDDDLEAGRLVAPFAQSVPKGAWHLVYRAERAAEPAFAAFRDWLVKAAREEEVRPGSGELLPSSGRRGRAGSMP